jgi:hypothetical protein
MSLTVRDLRRLWKPHKQRLHDLDKNHPTPIRFHRCCSWLSRADAFGSEDIDLALITRWIGFNALFGRWDERARQPAADRECWRRFLDRVVELDADGHIRDLLDDHRKLVLAILDDPYLATFFWRDPSREKAQQTTRDRRQATQWYHERRHRMILDNLVDRIYLLRCQLVHGAATHGSRLNRTSVRRCNTMLGHLLPAVLRVVAERGGDEDWGAMCYPPQG